MRGIFSAGVLNAFGRTRFDPFDMYIGVSAGACNLASHLAGQNDRNYDINITYSTSPRFINPGRFLLGGHYMDLDWLWDVTIREYRLDLKALFSKLENQDKRFIVVATSMESGKALYLEPDEYTLEHYLKVSSSLPILYRKILEVGAERATDGGIADSIPVIEACRRGASDITVIRSRPSEYVKKKSGMQFVFSRIFKEYPHLINAYRTRADAYMKAVDFINKPPEGVRIHEIAIPYWVTIGRTTRNRKVLDTAYRLGMQYGLRYCDTRRKSI